MTRRAMRAWALLLSALWALPAFADATTASPPVEAPHADGPVRFDAETDALVVSAAGVPERGLTRGGAPGRQVRRLDAVARSERRAVRVLHAQLDAALAASGAMPWVAERVHGALVLRPGPRRDFADGSVVIRWSARVAPLRAAAVDLELPW